MSVRKQNLILFFEKNDDTIIIDSKLVRLYVYHSVIDENAQTEIDGVYQLSKKYLQQPGRFVGTDKFVKKIMRLAEKLKPLQDQLSYSHFIIGSHFGVSWCWKRMNAETDFRQYFMTIFRQVWSIYPESFAESTAITVLNGEYGKVCSKNYVQATYEESASRNWINGKDSVGDDLELFHERLMTSSLLAKYRSDEVQKMFLFLKLTTNNLDQIGPFDHSRRFPQISFENRRKSRDRQVGNKIDDAQDKFLQNDCFRMTFFI